MNKKQLDEKGIVNELKGSSLFFQRETKSPTPLQAGSDSASQNGTRENSSTHPTPIITPAPPSNPPSKPLRSEKEKIESKLQGSTDAIRDASANASMLACHPASLIEEIRKTVKATGKEVSFVRLTPEEKNLLVDIVYTYKRQGVKTSENEINRIAVNFLLMDFKVNGAASILTRVIEALLA